MIDYPTSAANPPTGEWPTLEDKIKWLEAERDRLREALEPFATFAEHAVEQNGDHYGWTGRIGHERICDWFGPTDFGEALTVRGPQAEPSE